MDWAEEIRKIRDSKGLSDAKTAAELGVSKQYLSAVLTQAKEPSKGFKIKVWSMLNRELDVPSALLFLKQDEAAEILKIDSDKDSQPLSSKPAPKDWVEALVNLRDRRGLNNASFAAELGVSAAFLSTVLARIKPVPWKLKMAIWSRDKYDLTRDSLLHLFLPDIANELIEIDRQRGVKRASKMVTKVKVKSA